MRQCNGVELEDLFRGYSLTSQHKISSSSCPPLVASQDIQTRKSTCFPSFVKSESGDFQGNEPQSECSHSVAHPSTPWSRLPVGAGSRERLICSLSAGRGGLQQKFATTFRFLGSSPGGGNPGPKANQVPEVLWNYISLADRTCSSQRIPEVRRAARTQARQFN